MTWNSARFVCCAITACMLLVPTTKADDSPSKNKPQNKSQSQATQQWIDQLSTKVELTSDQQDKIRQQLKATDQKVSSTWKKFAEANANLIAIEATMYAAIEDGMDEQQKQQFRERRKDMQSSSKQGQNKQSKDKPDRQQAGTTDATATLQADSQKNTDNQKTDASHPSGKQKANASRDASNVASNDASNKVKGKKPAQQAASRGQTNQSDPAYFYVTEMIIVPAQKLASDVQMNDQQRQQCDQACQQFHNKLRQAYREVQRYHDELVQLEAEKLRAVESVLNEAQLKKLKEDRSSDQAS